MAGQNPPPPRPEQFVPGATPTPEQLASLPHDNQGIMMNAVSWSLAGIATLFLILRLSVKLWRRKRLSWDDYILIAAWVRERSTPSFCTLNPQTPVRGVVLMLQTRFA